MNKLFTIGILLALSINQSMAEETGKYSIWKLGQIQHSDANVTGPTNMAYDLGYAFNNSFAVETEFSFSVAKGSVNQAVQGYPNGYKWDIYTLGVYGVYQTQGQLFVKARAGVVKYVITTEVSSSDSGANPSWGVGLGYKLQNPGQKPFNSNIRVDNRTQDTHLTVSSNNRTMPLTSSATPTDTEMENSACLRPMVLSMTAKVEMQGM